MTGWIVKNRFSEPDTDVGDILGSDGLIYTFRYADCDEKFFGLKLKTFVSFTPVQNGNDSYEVLIDEVLTETREKEISDLDDRVEKSVSLKRYLHIFRVAKIACALANRFGGSVRKAEIAGLMHDAAKENTMDENRRIIKEAGMPLADFELKNHSILHAAAGAVVAAEEYGITDREILDAVRYHNGRPAMKQLEKIIFLADHLDYIYKNHVRSGNDIIQEKNIDRAIFKMFTVINQVLVKDGSTTDPVTESTMNYMFVKLNETTDSATPTKDTRTPISDELFDRVLEISMERGVHLRSVKNARELGGCSLKDDKLIRRGMLIRSANLSNLSANDAQRLAELGIRTVIDLRNAAEIKNNPDKCTEIFQYEHFPLPTLELTEYQKNVQQKYFLTPPGPEKAYYLSEYLSCISMKDLYMRIMTDNESINNIRNIFDLLCTSDNGGFLFHCSDGKDRTGIIAALIMLALGASEKDILEDYYTSVLASFSETESFAQSLRSQHYSEDYIDEIRYFNGIGMNIAENVRDELKARYGSAENYLKNEIISEKQILLLRSKFTDPIIS